MANAIVEAAKKRREKLFADYRQRQTQQEQQKAQQPGMRFDEKRGRAFVVPGSQADPQARPSRLSVLSRGPVQEGGFVRERTPLSVEDLSTSGLQQEAFNRELQSILGPTLQTLRGQMEAGVTQGQDVLSSLEAKREARLAELGGLQEERLGALEQLTEQQLQQAQQEAARASQDVAKRFGFSGFGRSTEQVGEQERLAAEANRINAEIRNQAALQRQLILAETSGASDAVLQDIQDQITAKQQQIDSLKSDFQQTSAELRLGAIEAGEAGVGALQARLQSAAEAEAALRQADPDLSEQLGYLVNAEGAAILSDAGEPIALKEAQEALKFISGTRYQGSGVFDPNTGQFTSIGGGRAGLIGGGGGLGTGSAELGFDPEKERFYREVIEIANREGTTLSEAADEIYDQRTARQIATETENYTMYLANQQAQAQSQAEAARTKGRGEVLGEEIRGNIGQFGTQLRQTPVGLSLGGPTIGEIGSGISGFFRGLF